jgi:hypothetical protein
MNDDHVIPKLRQIFNQFKQPYLLGPTDRLDQDGGGDTNPSIQSLDNYTEGEKHLYELYNIFAEVVKAGGVIPKTDDITKRAIYNVFEKMDIFPALRANSELKEPMLHYAKLDLVTYPNTFSQKHVNVLSKQGIPNTELNQP